MSRLNRDKSIDKLENEVAIRTYLDFLDSTSLLESHQEKNLSSKSSNLETPTPKPRGRSLDRFSNKQV